VVTDRGFLYVSEVGPVCDEICGSVGIFRVAVALHGPDIVAEEILEGPCTETALQPGAVWGEDMIRFCVTDKMEDQMSSRVDELTLRGVYYHTHRSAIPYCIEDPVRGELMISVTYIEPEAVEVE